MSRQIQSKLFWFNIISIILLGVLFLTAALRSFIADSEIWGVTLSGAYLGLQNGALAAALIKPLFSIFIQMTYSLPFEGLDLVLANRVLFGLLGLFSAVLVFLIARQQTKSREYGALAVILLLSSSFFLTRGFRVRSDVLATALSLAFLLSYFRAEDKKNTNWVLFISPLLATPKAVYLILAQLSLNLGEDKKVFLKTLIFGLAIAMLPALFTLKFSPVSETASYFLNSFDGNDDLPPYFSLNRFSYYYQFFLENPVFTSMTILSTLYSGWHFQNTRHIHRFSLILLVALFFHPNKLPFFLASYLPFFSITIVVFLYESLPKVLRSEIARTIFIFLFSLALTLKGCFFVLKKIESENNSEQILAVNELFQQIEPFWPYKIYDIVGLNPRRTTFTLFLGPGMDLDKDKVVKKISNEKPDFVVYVKKIAIIEPEFYEFLVSNYQPLGNGVWGLKERNFPKINFSQKKTFQELIRYDF